MSTDPIASSAPQVITLWELYGCGMEQVAVRVAEDLGLPVHGQAFSSEQIEESAARREKQGPLSRFLDGLPPVATLSTSAGDAAITKAEAVEETARQVTSDVARYAERGGVILGRNGAFLLHNRPNSLHVKLVGRLEDRVANAARISGISTERAARRQPIEDAYRRELSRETFHFDPPADDYYDLVIDATRFTPDQVATIIVAAARCRGTG